MSGNPAVQIALFMLTAAISSLALRDAWRAWQPARLLLRGRYAEAQSAAELLERSWMRVIPGVAFTARYTRGCAAHLAGELDRSLEATAPLHGLALPPLQRYGLCSLDAATLVLLGKDLVRARVLLAEAARIRHPPEDMLLEALARQSLGEADDAARLFAAAGTSSKQARQASIFHALRGLYLVNDGRSPEAQADLTVAANGAAANVYVDRARALLAKDDVELEGPSSLAPQVVAKAAER